jgi:hypothetical protein
MAAQPVKLIGASIGKTMVFPFYDRITNNAFRNHQASVLASVPVGTGYISPCSRLFGKIYYVKTQKDNFRKWVSPTKFLSRNSRGTVTYAYH